MVEPPDVEVFCSHSTSPELSAITKSGKPPLMLPAVIVTALVPVMICPGVNWIWPGPGLSFTKNWMSPLEYKTARSRSVPLPLKFAEVTAMGLNGAVEMKDAFFDEASGNKEMESLAEFTATRESVELPSK